MKIGKLHLDLKDGVKKEWLITNGIGGYASSTVIGANTRRYHGLLIAALNPPLGRQLICSKLDENVSIGGKDYPLFTNICKSYISNGYKNLESFEKEYFPIFNYKVGDIKIEKRVVMHYGHNTTIVQYNIKGGRQEAELKISPLINLRDFHEMTTGKDFMLKQEMEGKKIRITVNGDTKNPIFISCSEGRYNYYLEDVFRNMYYIKEEERGFFPEENHAVSGCLVVAIKPKEDKTVNFIISTESDIEKIKVNKVFEDEIKRIDALVEKSELVKVQKKYSRLEKEKNQVLKDLIIATDAFVVDRNFETIIHKNVLDEKTNKKVLKKEKRTTKLKTVIAGYPWHTDMMRNTLISFEGIFLITKRYQDAQKVLVQCVQNMKNGLIPNCYLEYTNNPAYNGVDNSLLLFEAVNRYLAYTKNYDFVKAKLYDKLKDCITNYINGINIANNNVYITKDGLLHSGGVSTQNTWMDTRVGEFVVNPRNGEPVEINALFYNALKTVEALSKKFEDEKTNDFVKPYVKKIRTIFHDCYYNDRREIYNDLVEDDRLRPNQAFVFGLTYQPVDLKDKEVLKAFDNMGEKLLMTHGFKTLARGEYGYKAEYAGDSYQRDMVCHQGPTWVWFLGLYLSGLQNVISAQKDDTLKKRYITKLNKFTDDVYVTYKKELYDPECVGQISEIYDSKLPYKPGGCVADSWSVSEVLKVILKRNK